MRIGALIIGGIDDDGYLRMDISEIADMAGVSPEEAAKVLSIIQQFDPTGVGARTLEECLLIQLESLRSTGISCDKLELAERLIKEHLLSLIHIFCVSGERIRVSKAKAPDSRKIPIATNIPTRKGTNLIAMANPSFAPSMNVSYTLTFFAYPAMQITAIIRGTTRFERAATALSSIISLSFD